ncbi:SDR family oxidoreductase [candidate division KSB1 bacterium]
MAVILILGALSDIARSLAQVYARNKFDLVLAARRSERLERDVEDLKIRYGVHIDRCEFDVTDYGSHKTFYESLDPKPDGVICAVGYFGEHHKAHESFNESRKIIDTNYTGCVSILNIVAGDFEKRGKGFIVGISSVAGDRGRRSNYLYGSAKAGFTAYLSGLRGRLSQSGIQVLTVKPGFVYTKMTEDMDLPGILTAEPDKAAADIFNAQQKGRDVVYTKWFWRYLMTIIKHIPERFFKRISF